MIRVINYGSGRYEKLANEQFTNGLPLTTYNNPFKVKERGDGYWVWKPWILLSAMRTYPSEFILYIDAGDYHAPEFWHWLNQYATVNDQLFCTRGYIHHEWTKGDCFEAMGCLPLMDRTDRQLEAGLIGLRANDENIALVQEWAKWMENRQILDDTPSIYPNHPNFVEHRHDQSILTNLILQRDIPMHYVNSVVWNAK